MPPHVLVLKSVLAEIEKEIDAYRHSNIETGGILVGARLDDEVILVIGATGPGPRAEHHAAEYALDHVYAQRKLDLYTAKYPDTDYVGEWHRHPGNMDRPSRGDWETAA